jgi:dimethylargininase
MKKIFKFAIVKRPCPEMVNGITKASLGKPDYQNALKQHDFYIDSLEKCGLNVKVLEADSKFPDSTFIEDVSVCTPHCAIITNPGALARNGEIKGMKNVLQEFYKNIEEIKAPGTLDGGDVMMVGDHYYIGLSARTNDEGADQFISILNRYEMTGSKVKMKDMLHLKTGLSYLENNNLLIAGEFVSYSEFEKFNRIVIDQDGSYSANSLWINGTVFVPRGYPGTKKKIEGLGYNVKEVDTSEFRKLDGGLSCLSLRF